MDYLGRWIGEENQWVTPKSPSDCVPITSFSVLECYLIWLHSQHFLI